MNYNVYFCCKNKHWCVWDGKCLTFSFLVCNCCYSLIRSDHFHAILEFFYSYCDYDKYPARLQLLIKKVLLYLSPEANFCHIFSQNPKWRFFRETNPTVFSTIGQMDNVCSPAVQQSRVSCNRCRWRVNFFLLTIWGINAKQSAAVRPQGLL